MSKNDLWVEKYRPKKIDDIIGQNSFKEKIKEHIKKGHIPNLLFYCSTPGTGKTTTAKVIVKELGLHYLYLNAADENNVETVRGKIKTFAQTQSIKGKYKIIILDEFSWFSKQAQSILFNMMEEYSDRCRFILTGNYLDKILPPIISRTQKYQLTPPNKNEVKDRLLYICNNEELDYNESDIDIIINNCFPDIRDCIQSLQSNTIDNKLKIENISNSLQYYDELIKLLTSKSKNKFLDIRKLINDSSINDWENLIKQLYLDVENWGKGKELDCIIHLSRCTVDIQFIPQELKEIVFMDCISELIKNLN